MSISNVALESKNYLNIQGIANLKGEALTNPQLAKHEVSQQFESILVQMLIKSMRDANKALFDNKEMDSSNDMYQDLFDKQVSLSISGNPRGFGATIENYISQTGNKPDEAMAIGPRPNLQSAGRLGLGPTALQANLQTNNRPIEGKKEAGFDNELKFVTHLLDYAKKAALSLGVDPKLLIAQAALETGWGKNIIANNSEHSFNLFNIKADSQWNKKSVEINTLEEKEGLIFKERSTFRAYDSYAESFNDYVDFIKNNPRYQEALKESDNPERYMQLLQQANYATDSEYSNKVMTIYHGERLNNLLQKAQLI